MREALLLNATYEPLRVIPLTRAIRMIVAEKVDVVEVDDEDPVRSQRTRMGRPTVVRLRYYVKVPTYGRLQLCRRNVLARDEHRCAYCRGRARTMDHVVPRARGGEHRWENVVAACEPCNNRKGDRLLAELGWTLPFTPRAPHGLRWLLIGVTAEPDPTWAAWLPVA